MCRETILIHIVCIIPIGGGRSAAGVRDQRVKREGEGPADAKRNWWAVRPVAVFEKHARNAMGD